MVIRARCENNHPRQQIGKDVLEPGDPGFDYAKFTGELSCLQTAIAKHRVDDCVRRGKGANIVVYSEKGTFALEEDRTFIYTDIPSTKPISPFSDN